MKNTVFPIKGKKKMGFKSEVGKAKKHHFTPLTFFLRIFRHYFTNLDESTP